MQSVILLSDDDAVIERIREVVADAGHALGIANNWAGVVQEMIAGGAHAILVDGNTPGASGPVLLALAEATGVPTRAVAAPLPPLPHGDDGELRRWVAANARSALTVAERYRVGLVGLEDGEATVERLAASDAPAAWVAEAGTSVLWLSQLVHRLSGRRGPFVVAHDRPSLPDGPPGTLYLPDLDRRSDSEAALALARARGWRVLGTASSAPAGCEAVAVVPLRERPGDLRPLLRLFLEAQRQRLGLPWLRASSELYAAVEAHTWPGNEAELEAFVVQAAPHGGGSSIRLDDLPERVRSLLDPGRGLELSTATYERIAEAWIRPIVQRYEPGGPSLYRRVIDATESALIRAAYERAGSQLAASKLLGVARNTLRAREARLDPRGRP